MIFALPYRMFKKVNGTYTLFFKFINFIDTVSCEWFYKLGVSIFVCMSCTGRSKNGFSSMENVRNINTDKISL
jgi:hypothetical protein